MAWVHDHEIKYEGKQTFKLYNLADLQIGSSGFFLPMLKRWIERIVADPDSLWCLLGDITDDDRPTTRQRKKQAFSDRDEVLKSAVRDHLGWIDNKVVPLLAPLTKRPCLGILAGHHWMSISQNWNSAQYICHKLSRLGGHKVPYLGEMSAWVRLHFVPKRKEMSGHSFDRMIHIQHGVGGSQAVGSALKKLEKARAHFEADAFIRAHDCKLEATKVNTVGASRRKGSHQVIARVVPLLNTGSATRGYLMTKKQPAYPEDGMMAPNAMGWGTLEMEVPREFSWERMGEGRKNNGNWTVEFFCRI